MEVRARVIVREKGLYSISYDGAKEMLLVEDVDDRGFLVRLVEALYEELPERRK